MKPQNGFSLIELAIVLVIVTLLIGGLAVPLSAQIEARRIAETRKIMEEAREALMGYAMTHSCKCEYDPASGSLLSGPQPSGPTTTCTGVVPIPCPATNPNSNSTTLKRPYLPCPDTNGDGTENRLASGECDQARGYFPWVGLSTASQDAWGNRILYAITGDLADSTKGFHNTAVSSGSGNQVLSSTARCSLTPPYVDVAADVPVVLISHGPNSRGARNVGIPAGSATPTTPAATGADERQNLGSSQNSCPTSTFISTNPSSAFDDLVAWLPFGALISRVCPSPGGCQ